MADLPLQNYLTVKEVASLFQVEEKTVYRWIQRRLIRAERIGRTVRVKKSEVERKHYAQYEPPERERDPSMG